MTDAGAPVPHPSSSEPPQLAQRLAEAGDISLRMLAGAVGKRTFESLRSELPAAPDAHAVLHRAVLAERVEPEHLLQKGLAAQLEWVARGGRLAQPRLAFRSKRLLARLCAQMVISAIYAVLFLTTLFALKHHDPDWDVYRVLDWLRELGRGMGAGR